MILIPGLERIEGFIFSDNWKIITDYIFSESGLIDSKCQGNMGRSAGNIRRSQLFKDGTLISEAFENNPHYISHEEIVNLINEGKFIGEEFDRNMNFPNGYVAKIEYLNSKNKQDTPGSIYSSKYRRLVLLDDKNQVLVDVIQDNPQFGKTPYTREKEKWYRSMGIV